MPRLHLLFSRLSSLIPGLNHSFSQRNLLIVMPPSLLWPASLVCATPPCSADVTCWLQHQHSSIWLQAQLVYAEPSFLLRLQAIFPIIKSNHFKAFEGRPFTAIHCKRFGVPPSLAGFSSPSNPLVRGVQAEQDNAHSCQQHDTVVKLGRWDLWLV